MPHPVARYNSFFWQVKSVRKSSRSKNFARRSGQGNLALQRCGVAASHQYRQRRVDAVTKHRIANWRIPHHDQYKYYYL